MSKQKRGMNRGLPGCPILSFAELPVTADAAAAGSQQAGAP